jgi:hypothetical protein
VLPARQRARRESICSGKCGIAAPIILILVQEQAVIDMCAHPVVCVALLVDKAERQRMSVALLLARTLLTACVPAAALVSCIRSVHTLCVRRGMRD